jgi:hypothetical protein
MTIKKLMQELDSPQVLCSTFVLMSDTQEITARRACILAELSELGLASARDLHQRQLAAETVKDAALLASSLHRISRSVRQTLALEAKLDRDAKRDVLDARKEARREAEARVARRKAQVKATVERLIWDEAETQEREDHLRDVLTTFLDEDDLYGHLAEGDIDTHIARLCEKLGLKDPPLQGVGAGGEPGGLAAGGRSPKATEGVEAHSRPNRSASQPIGQSLRDSSPSGGASGGADHPWRSSA